MYVNFTIKGTISAQALPLNSNFDVARCCKVKSPSDHAGNRQSPR